MSHFIFTHFSQTFSNCSFLQVHFCSWCVWIVRLSPVSCVETKQKDVITPRAQTVRLNTFVTIFDFQLTFLSLFWRRNASSYFLKVICHQWSTDLSVQKGAGVVVGCVINNGTSLVVTFLGLLQALQVVRKLSRGEVTFSETLRRGRGSWWDGGRNVFKTWSVKWSENLLNIIKFHSYAILLFKCCCLQ